MAENKCTDITPLPAPFMIQLYPTNRCNSNCRFCWRHNHPQQSREISDERWLEIADEICALNVPFVTFVGGGEPLLRARLVLLMMEKFSRTGIKGGLITNGMLITKEIAKKIVELEWESIQVSIHAPTAQLNDFLMGTKGAFNLALQGIKNLNTYKRLRKSAFPELTMRIVVTRFNFSILPQYIRFAKSWGGKAVEVRMVCEGAGTEGTCSLSEKEKQQFRDAVRHAKELAKEADIVLKFEFEMESPTAEREDSHYCSAPSKKDHMSASYGAQEKNTKEASCYLPFGELIIFANGTAGPCCYFSFSDMQFKSEEQRAGWLEDITHQPLRQVWEDGFAALRSSMLSKEFCPTCMRCSRDPNRPELTFFHRAFGHLREHEKYIEGVQLGRELVKKYPDNATLYRYLAEFHMELGEYGAAIDALERLENIGECVEDLHFLLGRCHFEIGGYKKALMRFKTNLTKNASQENLFRTWHLMAICHLRLRHYGEMKHCLKKTKELAEQLRKKGPFEDKHRHGFVEQWPAPFFHEEFRQLGNIEEYRKGILFGLEQLKGYPDNAVLHHYIGEFHMELGGYDKAIRHLSKAVELDPKLEWTHFSLGKCLYLTRRHENAEKAFKDNLRLTSERLSHYHSWLFLAMVADARNDRSGCQKALQSLKEFKEFNGKEIPLEQEFLTRLEQEKRLPR